MECRHLNGNPLDARLENLAWGTRAENYADRRGHGTANDGERHGNAVLTNALVLEVYAAEGAVPEIAARFDVPVGQVRRIKLGQVWSGVTGAVAIYPGTAGKNNGRARLTEVQVRRIRASAEPIRVLANRYGVNYNTVAMARRGQTWKHLQ
jgi:hypothetical protein